MYMKSLTVKITAAMLMLSMAEAKAQAVYTDPVVTGAIGVQTMTLKPIQEKQKESLSDILKANTAVAAVLTPLHELEKKTYNYLYNAANGLDNIYSLIKIGYQVEEIFDLTQECLKLAKDNPKNTVYVALTTKEVTKVGIEVTQLVGLVKTIALDGVEFTNKGWNEKSKSFLSSNNYSASSSGSSASSGSQITPGSWRDSVPDIHIHHGDFEGVVNPKIGEGTGNGTTDNSNRHNLLNPVERMKIIWTVQEKLNNIEWKLRTLACELRYMNFAWFWRRADYESYFYVKDGERIAKDIIRTWERL